MDIFERLADETLENYILRLSDAKKFDKQITWQAIADNISIQFGIVRSESWVRSIVRKSMDLEDGEELLSSILEAKQSLVDKTLELKKERVKLQDERTQNNAYVRKLAREDTIKEIAFEVANKLNETKFLPRYNNIKNVTNADKEAILCVSDWHYGLDFKNPWNEFSPEICRDRVAKLRDKTIEYLKKHKISKLHLVNLQDLIAGRIHLGLRLESRYDVITQTIHVSEILAELISSLSRYVSVDYYDVLDNHSRLEPIKSDAQDLETLCRIIPWYLKERLKDNKKFTLNKNVWGDEIASLDVLGYKIIGVHGHKDSPTSVLSKMNNFTNMHNDIILMAHRHHMSMDESCNTALICNGSLMGTDSFASGLRLTSQPSQCLILCDKNIGLECIYRIAL